MEFNAVEVNDFAADADEVAERGRLLRCWSCGNTKRIERGDRAFLLRQGLEPRGIIASGTVTTPSYQDEHWDPVDDLRPVCPNCHAVIHRKSPPYTIEEVQMMLRPHDSLLDEVS